MVTRSDNEWEQFTRFGIVCLVSIFLLLALGIVYRSIMVAVVAGAIIAYIFDPLVERLCRILPIKRKTLVSILIVLVLTFFAICAVLVVPFIYEELTNITGRIPDALNYFEKLIIPILNWLKQAHIFPEETIEAGFRRLNLLQNVSSAAQTVHEIFLRTPVLIEAIFNFLMVPLVTYLFLAGKEKIIQLVKMWTPEDTHSLIGIFILRVDLVLRSVVKGQFLIAGVLGCLYMTGFSLIGVPSGVAIGALAGLCRIVPYLDVVVGIGLCSTVVLTQGAGIPVFIAVIGVVAVVQSLDGMIITPRIIGDRSGLHPIVVIASVFAFGTWFGLLGVLLAVPIVAASLVAVQTCLPYLKHSPFFRTSTLRSEQAGKAQEQERS